MLVLRAPLFFGNIEFTHATAHSSVGSEVAVRPEGEMPGRDLSQPPSEGCRWRESSDEESTSRSIRWRG